MGSAALAGYSQVGVEPVCGGLVARLADVQCRTGRAKPGASVDSDYSPTERRELRKSAVDNLERLYTVVAGLSLTTGVQRLLEGPGSASGPSALPGLPGPSLPTLGLAQDALPMFIAFVLTLLPFYHGANRYLSATYVFSRSEHPPRPLTAIIDFVFFFVQALTFYAMALMLRDPTWFFWLLVAVLLLDCCWIVFVYFNSPTSFGAIRWWLYLNIATAFLLSVMIATPLLPDDLRRWGLASAVAVVRTMVDYGRSWSFYWPGFAPAAEEK
jgi:hypothetical protein